MRQPKFTLLWLFPVWVALGIFRLAIITTPLRVLHRCYGRDGDLSSAPLPLSTLQCDRARHICRVVTMAARYTPWRSNCYPQALAAHLLLSLYGIPHVLFFGLRKSESTTEPYEAHAWVEAGEIVVTGGPHHRTFHVVRAFVTGGDGDVSRAPSRASVDPSRE